MPTKPLQPIPRQHGNIPSIWRPDFTRNSTKSQDEALWIPSSTNSNTCGRLKIWTSSSQSTTPTSFHSPPFWIRPPISTESVPTAIHSKLSIIPNPPLRWVHRPYRWSHPSCNPHLIASPHHHHHSCIESVHHHLRL